MSFIKPGRVITSIISTEVFPATKKVLSSTINQGRQFFEITNDGDVTVYLAFGQDAEIGKGTPLNSGDRYYLDISNNIDSYFIRFGCNAISDGDSALAIQEFNYDNI